MKSVPKYWGKKSLFKISGLIGKALKMDQATMKKDKLQYARVLIEVKLNQKLPELIRFINEKGVLIEQPVHFEWKPLHCEKCKGYGHAMDQCVRKTGKRVWRAKAAVGQLHAQLHAQVPRLPPMLQQQAPVSTAGNVEPTHVHVPATTM